MNDTQNQRDVKESVPLPAVLEEAAETQATPAQVEPTTVSELEHLAKPPETPSEFPIGKALAQVDAKIGELHASLSEIQTRLADLETNVGAIQKQVSSYLPDQIRQVRSRVDALNTSISEPRYRATLLSLLGIYDLVDQALRALPAATESEAVANHQRNYEVLRDQLRQILERNGLMEIDASGAFDPKIHQALERVSCTDPEQQGRIVKVFRPGFRTEHAVLRYAEVVVAQYVQSKTA